MSKMAAGAADDLASTVLLATTLPILIAPAMNVRMWQHPATARNLATLRQDGVHVVGPNDGAMAEAEFGPGRMAEPTEIADAAARLLSDVPHAEVPERSGGLEARTQGAASFEARLRLAPQDEEGGSSLSGLRVLVTSGPTHEPIDPVRYIANRSSGRQGHAIAAAAAAGGADVTLVSGPVSLPDPAGVTTVHVETAREMLAAVEAALPADIAVFAAAVADWRTSAQAGQKLKKNGNAPPPLELALNPDILATIAHRTENRPPLVVGFAAETERVIEHARAKLARKGCDLIVANDVSPATGVMGGELNTVHLVTAEAVETWPTMGKDEVARRLVGRLGEMAKAHP
jgi:phosphopantothenoylcysteine decarboxylase/phosphopantothenate--cysteine ligase